MLENLTSASSSCGSSSFIDATASVLANPARVSPDQIKYFMQGIRLKEITS